MKVWLAKLAQTYPQTAIIDGFASAGRYRDTRVGSPLIFLHGYLTHQARDNFRSPPHFVFIEEREDFADHLQFEVNQVADLGGARVDVVHGKYEDRFPGVVASLAERYASAQLPTFAFVDPLGYQKTPFKLLRDYRARLGATAESMVYVPIDFMARFVGQSTPEDALDRLFGSRDPWETIRDGASPGAEASSLLAEAYADALRGQYKHVSRFVVDPASRNRYYLFFGTDHIDGLKAMKGAYWKVDPADGRGYHQAIATHHGQGELFAPQDAPKPPEENLEELMRGRFGGAVFSVDDAELFALTETGFRETHVRALALKPAYDRGALEIVATPGRRKGPFFPAGTTMRFRTSS